MPDERATEDPQATPPTTREFDVRYRDARGPAPGVSTHVFCPTCKRAMYSVWVYGPVTPYVYNTKFCVCDGRWEGWDEADVARNKELRDRLNPEKANG